MAWVSIGGRITVQAGSQGEAEDIVDEMINNDEIDFLTDETFDVTTREYEIL